LRLVELGRRLAPIPTPAPVLAAELPRRKGGLFAGRSLLVSAYVEGRDLLATWGRDARAEAAFPALLAAMHRRRLFHGDLHPRNVLWDGAAWVVLDVGALRHPLRTWRPRALAEAQWAELDFRLGSPPSLRAAFDAYWAALGLCGDAHRAWARIVRRSAVLRASRS
jgi:Ser/Thr protein kinase RdoA (MazF antagonist)